MWGQSGNMGGCGQLAVFGKGGKKGDMGGCGKGGNGGGGSKGDLMAAVMSLVAEWTGGGGGFDGGFGGDGGYGKQKFGKGKAKGTGPYNCDHVTDAGPEDVEAFLSIHQVEPHAATRFRTANPKMQTLVIVKGTMADARDQTAVLMRRMTEIETMQLDDWICAGCFDLQFARNMSCRKCGGVRTDGGYGKAKGGKGGKARGTGPYNCEYVTDSGPEDVEAFLSLHQVEPHAVLRLRNANPKMQTLVIAKGSMADARDQTAVLMKRMTEFETMQLDDWVCPGCYDLQFAKNTSCRKCGGMNPKNVN